jgi:hypothetical protein
MRRSALLAVNGVSAIIGAYGLWFHFAVGPTHGPGLELGIGGLACAAVLFRFARRR